MAKTNKKGSKMASNTVVKSNAYTLTSLIREVSNLTPGQGRDAASVISSLSPRKSNNSVKIAAINNYLGGKLYRVLTGADRNTRGSSARTRLLFALTKRKNVGTY